MNTHRESDVCEDSTMLNFHWPVYSLDDMLGYATSRLIILSEHKDQKNIKKDAVFHFKDKRNRI